MLNKCKLLLALVLLLLVGGCNIPSWTTAGKIVPPQYDVCPLEGKWSVIEELGSEGYSGKNNLEAVGSFIQFSREIAILGSNVWNQPTYKIKKVNSNDYVMTRSIVLDSYLTSASKTIEVVTVFADSNYLGEFMKIDDTTVIAFVHNKVLLLNNVAEHADDPRLITNANIDDINQYNTGASGIFIGLKIPLNNGFAYKTIWVATNNKKLHPILSRNDIYFPRTSGFWELQVQSALKLGKNGEELSAHNVAEKDLAATKEKGSAQRTPPIPESIVIDYVGNDYVAINNNTGGTVKLQILPVDKLSSPIGIKIVDLLGAAGLKAYQSAREQTLQTLDRPEITWVDEDLNEDNFGLIRKNGHWHLQGRVNYKSNSIPGNMEFNINIIPPANLIFYDALYPGWQSIKDRVPNALDAFTSPNKDIAVVKTKSKMYFFGINGGQLDSMLLGEIALEEGTTIIMAEWATGFYVDDWEKNFINNGARVLKIVR